MQLTPKEPPGRITRRARAFEAEMARLRAEGYSLQAIREALAVAGIKVSKSTVQRELARQGKRRAIAGNGAAPGTGPVTAAFTAPALPPAFKVTPSPPQHRAQPAAQQTPCPAPAAPPVESTSTVARARDNAEAFVSSCITNPLLRNRKEPS